MKERYHVTGMSCSACSSHVEKAVNKLENVEKASVNLLTETMDVTYDETKITSTEIIDAVVKAGYGASVMTEGSVAGAGGQSTSGNAGSTGRSAADGKQELQQKLDADARAMKWRLGISIGFLIPLMYVSMHHMLKEWFGIPVPAFIVNTMHGNANAMNFALTQFLLLLPILYVNRKFFSVGFKTLAHRSPNMDSLIALGSGAALVYGIFAMYRISYGLGYGDMAVVEHYSHDLYFESSGTILTLITVGKYLESRSKGKTSEAITKLMNLAPKVAVLVTGDGQEKEVPTESLQKGDIFLVKPGSLVPVDGIVLEGNSSVDEAAITGESVPVEKQAGDHVVSATVNKAGFLKCRADRVGDDTTLAQIIRLVEEASASKAPIAQLADKVAGVFVPTVMTISLITLIVWLISGATAEFAISTAIAVLVISCPCALGLATPVAIMVGTGVGASNGILIKTGEALQQAKEIDTVVLDKTGTITSGKLKVEEAGGYQSDFPMDAMMQIAAALEKKSEHPLAEAVVEWAEQFGLAIPEIVDFKATFGRGVEGTLAAEFRAVESVKNDGPTAVFYAGKQNDTTDGSGKTTEQNQMARNTVSGASSVIIPAGTKFYVGNLAFLQENHITLPEEATEGLNRMADEGMTPLLVAQEGRFLGTKGEFVLAPRLDDLQSAFALTKAFTESTPAEYINICAVFDNEEVGSGTRQGADSTFLADVLDRITEGLLADHSTYLRWIADSFLISADNAHAVHPNHPEKADPTNRPYLNGGIVIKFHGSQKYTTDGISAAKMKDYCERAKVPYQTYANRSDIAGGSTLGNISTAHVSVSSVDIGLPQLAMHSAVETAGMMDAEYAVRALKEFWGE